METPQADVKRITAVKAKVLPEFKVAIKQMGIDTLRVRIEDALTHKQAQAQQTAIAEAVAKAKAEPRGILGMFL